MNSSAGSQLTKSEKNRKAYVAPAYRRMTPEEAKEFLLEKADVNDPEVKLMLKCIENLQKQNRLETTE